MKLIQIPFSHNCVKVRLVLERKGVPYELQNIHPMDRRAVFLASGQLGVPVIVDGNRRVVGSTSCALYVEERHPDPPLVPADPAERAECLLLEDWADRAFMAVSRRIAYWNVISTPGHLAALFFPRSSPRAVRVKEALTRRVLVRRFHLASGRYRRDLEEARSAAQIAVARLGGARHLVGGTLTLADIALASMSAPLAADPLLAKDSAVSALLAWGAPCIGAELAAAYRGEVAPGML